MIRTLKVFVVVFLLPPLLIETSSALYKLNFSEETKKSVLLHEGEKLVCTVQCNGVGEKDVTVTLEKEKTLYVSGTTNEKGTVTLQLPNVSFSTPFTVTAKKIGYETDTFTVWVIDKPRLYVSTPAVVEENSVVTVTVVDNQGNPVPDAYVVCGDKDGFTDSNGTLEFQAPAVAVPTMLKLYATHENYESSNENLLWVADNRTSVVNAPLWVEEGETLRVESLDPRAASLSFAGETKNTAAAVFTAPEVNETKVYSIRAYDENGTLIGYSFTVVLNKEKEQLLLFGPIEVIENEQIELHVLSLSNFQSLRGVNIRFADVEKTTDENGTIVFTAPSISKPYEKYTAEVTTNEGYCSTNWTVWVKKPEERSLQITGPTSAYEGELVNFNVTTGVGSPTFAKVSIENETAYTKNGSATLQLPEVSNPCYLTVKASKPGYLDGYTIIYVKNREKHLTIKLDENSVNEGESFLVKVVDANGDAVENATVWFNFNSYKTDDSGKLRLLAPDVLLTTTYLIYAEKKGFETASQWVTIAENGVGESFMELITPLAVIPWNEFIIKTIDKSGTGLAEVKIEVKYDSSVKTFETDENGEAKVRAPILTSEPYFTITATKKGYIQDSAVVLLMERNQLLNDLVVESSNSEVTEGEQVVVTVKDDDGKTVEGASVWVDGILLPDQTDNIGRLSFKTPSVLVDKTCFIFVTKSGYNFGSTWINIHNEIENMEAPVINTESVVYETQEFNITVTDNNGKPLHGVSVWFNALQKITDLNGKVVFTAPPVSTNTYFLLSVDKIDFAPAFKLIKVVDKTGSQKQPELVISTVPIVMEEEEFTVTVKDSYGYLIKDVCVTFNNQIEKYTNEYGQVNFTAPEVSRDSRVTLNAIKNGYSSATASIRVKNREPSFLEQYWFVITAVAVVIVIAVFAYFYYRQYLI